MTTTNKKKSSSDSTQNGFSLISNEKLLELYAAMLRCRMVEEQARLLTKRARRGAKNPVTVGCEAAAAGVLLDLRAEDALAAGPGDVASAFVKGVPLRALIAGLSAAPFEVCEPRNVLPPCAEQATRLALATGVALAAKQRKNGALAVVFYDGLADTPEPWQETMRFAGLHALPILYVCWNKRPERDLYLEAEQWGFPGIAVDGHDVVGVYRVASEAVAHARRGNGPTLIECKTGFPAGYGGGLFAGASDAIRNMEAYLAGKGLFNGSQKRKVIAAFSRELAAASRQNRKPARSQR